MGSIAPEITLTVGVLALQGAFNEHTQLLRQAATTFSPSSSTPHQPIINWHFLEVRTAEQLNQCDALIIPGGESTAISLVAERSGILEPLRDFVKIHRKPTWGTCAGLILLAESANRTKLTGQELIGGLDVRVNRNHFGRQVESFQAELDLPFLVHDTPDSNTKSDTTSNSNSAPRFKAIFIRAPVVESLLTPANIDTNSNENEQENKNGEPGKGIQVTEAQRPDTIVAPSRSAMREPVEVLARLPDHKHADEKDPQKEIDDTGDIIAVRQGNCFATSFHPELTGDERIHRWWLGEVVRCVVGDGAQQGQ